MTTSKPLFLLPLLFILVIAGCGGDEEQPTIQGPADGADLLPVAETVAETGALLNEAMEDLSSNNFGLAMGKVNLAGAALSATARIKLPLLVVSQRVYTADVNLRFVNDPARALLELEEARNYLKERMLAADEETKIALGSFLERLIAVIDDADVSQDDKLIQLEALQRDLAKAVLGEAPASTPTE